ncbi:hypothetical protein LXL04_002607 [Taraxacum kok-saghyz]
MTFETIVAVLWSWNQLDLIQTPSETPTKKPEQNEKKRSLIKKKEAAVYLGNSEIGEVEKRKENGESGGEGEKRGYAEGDTKPQAKGKKRAKPDKHHETTSSHTFRFTGDFSNFFTPFSSLSAFDHLQSLRQKPVALLCFDRSASRSSDADRRSSDLILCRCQTPIPPPTHTDIHLFLSQAIVPISQAIVPITLSNYKFSSCVCPLYDTATIAPPTLYVYRGHIL